MKLSHLTTTNTGLNIGLYLRKSEVLVRKSELIAAGASPGTIILTSEAQTKKLAR